MADNHLNWAGNYRYRAARLRRPDSVEEVQEIVAKARKVHALGTRHSFNAIADSEGDLVSMDRLHRLLALPSTAGPTAVACFEGGITYGRACPLLEASGWAFPNLASLPHISIAGACATGTHGSGPRQGILSTAVRAMDVVRADGEVERLGGNDLKGAAVGLGRLGIAIRLELAVVPAFDIAQRVYEGLPFRALADHFDEIQAAGYSVSLFTTWGEGVVDQVWIKRLAPGGSVGPWPDLNGASPTSVPRHPAPGASPEVCSDQSGTPGPSYRLLPHFRMEHAPSCGEELQSEYFIPRTHTWRALCAIDALRDRIRPILHVSEVRTIASDDLWMSPCHGRDSTSIHFSWKREEEAVAAILPEVEERLEPFGARPHWGKLFAATPRHVAGLYPELPQFRKLAERLDPGRKFSNPLLDRILG